MKPPNESWGLESKLNQHIEQALSKTWVKRVTVVLEEVFGDSNDNYIEIRTDLLASMEYAEGMLVLDYVTRVDTADKEGVLVNILQMISKDRIKRIYFDSEHHPKRLPFPKYDNQPITEL